MSTETNHICSVCGREYTGFGNNAWPINPGRCCNDCNQIVVGHRMLSVSRGKGAYPYPEWCNDEFWKELSDMLQRKHEEEIK